MQDCIDYARKRTADAVVGRSLAGNDRVGSSPDLLVDVLTNGFRAFDFAKASKCF
jgi:hypothetical protein